MKKSICLLAFAVSLVVPFKTIHAQQQTALLVSCDMACTWTLDKTPQGALGGGEEKLVPVSPGRHTLRADPPDHLMYYSILIEVAEGEQRKVKLLLRYWHDDKQNRMNGKLAYTRTMADLARHPTWTDPTTGLMWTRTDTGQKLTWQQAVDYCANLTLGGYSDWRLPEIDELAALYDPAHPVLGWKAGSNIVNFLLGEQVLVDWQWSNTSAKDPREAQYFLFNNGSRYGHSRNHAGMSALCVRAATTSKASANKLPMHGQRVLVSQSGPL
jgi:hypothetical protein